MSGSNSKHNNNRNYPPPPVDELMKALAARNDDGAITAFSRALFLVDAPHFVSSYRGSKAAGKPIQFERAGAMAGHCYAQMDALRVDWLVYANVAANASEPYNDFIAFLAETLNLPKFKQYYQSFLVYQRMSPLEQEAYYEGIREEKMKYHKESAAKEAEAREVARLTADFDAFAAAATAKKPEGGAGSGRTRRTRRSRRSTRRNRSNRR